MTGFLQTISVMLLGAGITLYAYAAIGELRAKHAGREGLEDAGRAKLD